jgi:hypothetical protein
LVEDNHQRDNEEKSLKEIKDLEIVEGVGGKEAGGGVGGGRKEESQLRLEGEIFWKQWKDKCEEVREENGLLQDGEGAVSLEVEIEEIAELEEKSELDDECREKDE